MLSQNKYFLLSSKTNLPLSFLGAPSNTGNGFSSAQSCVSEVIQNCNEEERGISIAEIVTQLAGSKYFFLFLFAEL